MEFLGIPLAIAAVVAVLVANRPMTFGVVTLCTIAAFAGLWVGTNHAPCPEIGTEVSLGMCRQSLAVWDAYRMLFIGGPALVILVVWAFRLPAVMRDALAIRSAR